MKSFLFTFLLIVSSSANANSAGLFQKVERLAGKYSGYHAIGSTVYACEVRILNTLENGVDVVRVNITGEGIPPYSGTPVDEDYRKTDPIYYSEHGDIFIERHTWVGGQVLGGTFELDGNDELTTIKVSRIGPGGGHCSRLSKL